MKKYLAIFPALAIMFFFISGTSASFSDSQAVNSNQVKTGIWNPGKITIIEVFYDPIGDDAGNEFIRLRNTGGYRIQLENYVLHFEGSTSNDFVFPRINLAPGKEVLVHLRVDGINTPPNLYWNNTGNTNLNNDFGSVSLFRGLPKNSDNIIDFVQYGEASRNQEVNAAAAGIWTEGAFVPDANEGYSLRLRYNQDNNLISDWRHRLVPVL